MKDINESNFEKEVLQSDKPVVVDFWAPWCVPCINLSPLIADIETENKNVKFVKVNVDENQQLAQSFGVRSIPTLISYKNGKLQNVLNGLAPRKLIEEFVKKI